MMWINKIIKHGTRTTSLANYTYYISKHIKKLDFLFIFQKLSFYKYFKYSFIFIKI